MEKIIISVAPNGARKLKKDHPNIPLTAKELGEEAKRCVEEGAVLFHLHVRDEKGNHSLSVDHYRAAIDEIRDKVGNKIIIQTTTENCGIYTPEQQMQMVKTLKPEAISVAIREIIPDRNNISAAKDFLFWVYQNNIMPQYILYSPEEVRYFIELCNKDIIPQKKKFVLFVLGKKNAPQTESTYAKPEDLKPFLEVRDQSPEVSKFLTPDPRSLTSDPLIWAICAFGGNENACMLEAVKHGGHIRIGFENNHLMKDGSVATYNSSLVRQFVGSKPEREIATIEEAREMLS